MCSTSTELANRIGFTDPQAHAADLDPGNLLRFPKGTVPYVGSSAHAHGGSLFPERLPFDASLSL